MAVHLCDSHTASDAHRERSLHCLSPASSLRRVVGRGQLTHTTPTARRPPPSGLHFHGCLLSSPLVSLLTQYFPECTFMVFHDIKGVVWDLTDLFPVGLRKVFKRPGR